jgi:transcriptional regulator with XRE-family HTH domain
MADKGATPVDAVVGRNIRMHRERCGLTQTDLARKVGITKQQIHKYEVGVSRVSPGRLDQIAVILDVPLVMLFGGSPEASVTDDEKTGALLAKPSSLRLIQAFARLKRASTRIAILELIEALGKERGRGQ